MSVNNRASKSAIMNDTEFETIELGRLQSEARYHLLTQSIVPRPIAWALTRSQAGVVNLAPFSYFNAVCSDPAIVMISVGSRGAGVPKDTARNILETKLCVIHIASQIHQNDLELSAAELEFEDSELRLLGLSEGELVVQQNFSLPRLPFASVALNCILYDYHQIGEERQNVLYLRVETLVLSRNVARFHKHPSTQETAIEEESFATRRIEIDPLLLDPLARLGSGYYAGLQAIRRGRR